jgi:hypothetical protein
VVYARGAVSWCMLELLCLDVLQLVRRGAYSSYCALVYPSRVIRVIGATTVTRLTMATMVTKGDRQLRL